MEKLIDGVWNSSLVRITKKGMPPVRPSLGDDIDLFIPQVRTILLLQANPALASLIYGSSYASASRNAYAIMKKLGMPADYFWKFEYWPRDRALDTLRRVINRVFSTMMSQNKEGLLDIKDVDIEHMRFTMVVKECVECIGITAESGICYYHVATLSGIIAALINRDMDGYETECQAKGDDTCTYIVGKKDDADIAGKLESYLSPGQIEMKVDDRLDESLKGHSRRSQGNLVNISYYQLTIANSIITDPTLSPSSSFNVGTVYGVKLASFINNYYHEDGAEAIKKYYNQLHYLAIKKLEMGTDVNIVMEECPEVAGVTREKELLGFLLGELQGLMSTLMNQKMTYQESAFENGNLIIRLSLES
ncbi:MAG: 4-vinyl reductase [Chloroflexota bacterium]